MSMTRTEALDKIKELQDYIDEWDKHNINKMVITPKGSYTNEVTINDRWVMNLFEEEREGSGYVGHSKSKHKASAFFADCFGTWYDENGDVIRGYIYFMPNVEQQDD